MSQTKKPNFAERMIAAGEKMENVGKATSKAGCSGIVIVRLVLALLVAVFLMSAAVFGILKLTDYGTVTAKTDPVKSPGTGAAKAAKAGVGDTQTIGGLEITVKSVDRSLVVEWTEGSQVEGSPFFGVAVRWKNVGTNVIEDPPVWSASTADGTMNDGVAAEPSIGKQRGNLQVGINSGNYHLLPGTAREGWLTFEQKPGPLTKLYITVGGDTATWALTK